MEITIGCSKIAYAIERFDGLELNGMKLTFTGKKRGIQANFTVEGAASEQAAIDAVKSFQKKDPDLSKLMNSCLKKQF
ncbi:MAG: hypothetical protein Q4C49_06140 [Bacillota bacterium]|nr:hypothetical protein [Bacillota bacterium]